MRKKIHIPNGQWDLAAALLRGPVADRDDRGCFPGGPAAGRPDRGCFPGRPRPHGSRRFPLTPPVPEPDRDDRGCFPQPR